MKISLIIPMYNEEKIIAATAKTLSDYMSANFEAYEILFCDDGSSDACRSVVERAALPHVRALGYEGNRGKGCAVRTAMLEADGDVMIFTDADLAYGTDVIADAVKTLEAGSDADIVIGSRRLAEDGYGEYTYLRRVMSSVYVKLLCICGGFKLSDSQCGFKAFTKNAARTVFSECRVDGFAFDLEVILRAEKHGFKLAELPVRIINHRESSVRPLRDAFKMLGDLRRIKRMIRSEK